ncbi:MAG: hypothetical protein ACD_65C00017G0001, partial [uncultured bacterium]
QGGIRTSKFDGDGLILALSDEPDKEKVAASKMMQGAVEAYRQAYTINYIAKKLGCHTADIRFGTHYGKIYAGLQQYLDTPEQAHQYQVSAWFHKISKLLLEKERVKLAPPQGRKLHRIIEGMEGLGISIASRYQPASKGYTHFTISPELLAEIIHRIGEVSHVKTIGEKRDVAKSKEVKNAISVHDVVVDTSDIESEINAIFADPAHQALIENIKAEVQRDIPEFFLDDVGKEKEAQYEKDCANNLSQLNFHDSAWWQQNSAEK